MEKILIQDNFFDNAEDLRDLALSTRFFSAEEKNYDVGWRGYRTNEMRDLDKNILKVSCQKIKEELIKFFNLKIDDDDGNFYFHIALTHTKNTLEKSLHIKACTKKPFCTKNKYIKRLAQKSLLE